MSSNDISNLGPRPQAAPKQHRDDLERREMQPEVIPIVVFDDPEASSTHADPAQKPSRWGNVWKAIAGVAAALVASSMLMGLFALVTLALLVSLCTRSSPGTTAGANSCARSCTDSPVGDSPENKAFIADRASNDRDLMTFDALRGCIDALHDRRVSWSSDEGKSKVISTEELRSLVAGGSWPDASAGYDDVKSTFNPQLWVRIAELSQDEIENATGEQWDVVDFAYPFPDNGPIPVTATRDESSYIVTRLICRSGEDEGLYANVKYWRWEQPARFEADVEEARSYRDEAKARLSKVDAVETLQGRQYLLSRNTLYVWAQDSDDPLLDPELFVSFANEAGDLLGGYTSITLLAPDTPINVTYSPLSFDYPNELPLSTMTYEQCREALTNGDASLEFDHAAADMLLSAYRTNDSPCTEDGLRGTLAPNRSEDFNGRWYQPGEGAYVDDVLEQTVIPDMNVSNPEQIIAITVREEDWHDDRKDETLRTWVVVPRGALSESPEGFCSTINKLRDDIWDTMGPEVVGGGTRYQYSRFYVIDEQSITLDGVPLTFDELRALALTDMTKLQECSFEVLLAGYPSKTQWGDETVPNLYDCTPSDVGGSIAQSREWRYAQ